jgi:1-deoxyxylulose-5-phosphate synthase
MEYALLGRTGLRVSRLALGTAVFGLAPSEEDCEPLVHAAIDAGINLFDCANTYGNRKSFDRDGLPPSAERKHAEELLGRALRGKRDEVVLCTKVSEPVGRGPNDGGTGMPGRNSKGGGLSRYHLLREVENSLRRLNTDHIDVYHFHHPDPDTSIDESLAAADDLVRQGKVRYVGLSTFPGWQLSRAVMTAERLGTTRPILNQVAYNMVNRFVEHETIPAAIAHGLSVTCFSPLAGGALAGADARSRPHSGLKRWGMSYDLAPGQREVAEALDVQAKTWGHQSSHLALRWLLSRPAVASAIIGPETISELKQNLAALDLFLSPNDLETLDAIGRQRAIIPV